jgi:hypothetical protein
MRSVTYSMGVSLDGYIAGPDGDFDWQERASQRPDLNHPAQFSQRAPGRSRFKRHLHRAKAPAVAHLPLDRRGPRALGQLVARAVAIADEHHPAIRSQRRGDGRPVVTKRFALHNNVPPSNRANVAGYGTSDSNPDLLHAIQAGSVAGRGQMPPGVSAACADCGRMWPGAAPCLATLAPNLAPSQLVSGANVR